MNARLAQLAKVVLRSACGVAWLSCLTTAFGQYEESSHSAGKDFAAIALVDMDQDGRLEVLAGTRDPADEVEIWTWDSTLKQLRLVDTITGFPSDIHDVAAGDFDEDGDVDVAVTHRFVGLRVAFNQGGSWNIETIDGTYGWQTIVADFNDDGHLDIWDGKDFAYMIMYYGDGTGSFVSGPAPVAEAGTNYNAGRGFTAIDIDGNSRLDLIGLPSQRFTGGFVPTYFRAYLNTGTPGTIAWSADVAASTLPGVQPSGPNPPYCAADLDGDGNVDQVTPIQDVFNNTNQVGVFWGAAGPTWSFQSVSALPGVYSSAAVGDLNGDDNLDFIVSGSTSFTGLKVFYGDGAGNFNPSQIVLSYGVGERNALKIGDVNGDGLNDIVARRNVAAGNGFVLLRRTEGTIKASATTRNGTGINTLCLTSLTLPVLGTTWQAKVDHSGHPGATFTFLRIHAAPATGPVIAAGELLINLGSPFYVQNGVISPATCHVHSILVPADPALAGLQGSCQALILGGGPELCNALDLVLGF